MNKLVDFPYQSALVLGLAKSGTATAKLLAKNGVEVTVNDLNTEISQELEAELEELGVRIVLGSHPVELLDFAEVIIKNPGIPYTNPLLKDAEKRQIPILTELELNHYLIEESQLICLTGSNGKTTTTTLISEMFKRAKREVQTAGNIGYVSIEAAEKLKKDELLLLEVSSFQLQGTAKLVPHVAVMLNLYNAHLDFHGDFAAYVSAKEQITLRQTSSDYFVYNYDDHFVSEVARETKAQLIPFSLHKKVEGAWKDSESIYYKDEKVISINEIVLVGEHNLANILAAVAVVKLFGVSNSAIQLVLKSFSGVLHRLQYVETKNDRIFYNDSKATNVLATEQALKAFDSPTILLAGGLERNEDFSALKSYLKYVKQCVVFGETKERLGRFFQEQGVEVFKAERVKDAVETAYKNSEKGDTILLSPACASWDQYKTFEERGDEFIQAVNLI